MIDDFPEVLARARAGDRQALSVLYRRFNPGLERYLSARAPEVAEDLAADAWISVAESIGRFEGGEADFRGWLFTIARNRLIDVQRRSRRRPGAVPWFPPDGEDAPTPPASTDTAEDAALDELATEATLALVRRLPPDQADVIMLRVVAGLDTERVARVLGKRPGAIRVLQHRGLRNLARLIGELPPGTGAGR